MPYCAAPGRRCCRCTCSRTPTRTQAERGCAWVECRIEAPGPGGGSTAIRRRRSHHVAAGDELGRAVVGDELDLGITLAGSGSRLQFQDVDGHRLQARPS